MNIKVVTPEGISAEIVEHSKSKHDGSEIVTVNLRYGLIVHAEWLRHRMITNNVKSNRAIPAKVIRKEVLEDPYVPVWFGENQAGMVAENKAKKEKLLRCLWKLARYPVCFTHYVGEKLGLHKEVLNRLLSPWQWVRQTSTFTEGDNLYNLRLHKDAQKDIQAVVQCVYDAVKQSKPHELSYGEYHTPYVSKQRIGGTLYYIDNNGAYLSTEEAIKCSAARCARSSYDKHDGSKTTALGDIPLYDKLIVSEPAHASPVENQATPFPYDGTDPLEFEGITHVTRGGLVGSGNFFGWVQHRQTLSNHTCWNYVEN